ncbi:MAG: exodeoxyribonuclease VII small subunit [Candidatus Eisenbacteria sp.]|nr:exodeoxyribonuclease VII small subunit [Candidatus Eisenbacteria bacterium]
MTDKVTFEKALADLEKAVEVLERGELGLDESIGKFEEGVALAAKCADMLKAAELRVQKLVKRAEGTFDLEGMDINQEGGV